METFSHWLHITAAAVVVGSLVYVRFVLAPAMEALSEQQRAALIERLSARLRSIAVAAIVVLIVSGSYNFFVALEDGVQSGYHMAFGIKFLLAMHVFGMLYIAAMPPSGDAERDAKRPRLMFGAVISALIVLALGAYLGTLHN